MDTDYITLDGGSAGASTVIPAAIAQLPGDFVNELSDMQDPTLASTHRDESSSVRSVIAHWGAAYGVVAITARPSLIPPDAHIPRAQGSSGATATVPFIWRGHTKSRTTRAGRALELALRLG